jgi:hypothetical protein
LPASDTLTITSKLLADGSGPLIFWLVFVLAQIVMAVIASIMVCRWREPLDLFLSVLNPLKAWSILLVYLAASIWFLPIYGWLLLVRRSRRASRCCCVPPERSQSCRSGSISALSRWTAACSGDRAGVANSPAILTAQVQDGGTWL